MIFVQDETHNESHLQCGQTSSDPPGECVWLKAKSTYTGMHRGCICRQCNPNNSEKWALELAHTRASQEGVSPVDWAWLSSGRESFTKHLTDCKCLWGIHVQTKYWLHLKMWSCGRLISLDLPDLATANQFILK